MNFAAALPYLLPPDHAVAFGGWEDQSQAPVPDRFDHWDPSTDLQLASSVTVDLDLVRGSTGLAEDSALALTAHWYSSQTRLAGTPDVIEFGSMDGIVRAPLTVSTPGSQVGGSVDLIARLVLRHPGSTTSPIAPTKPGCTLWEVRSRVALEGSGARFPTSAVDFTEIPGMRHEALWTLEWEHDDPSGMVLADLRLLLNSSSPELVSAVQTGSSDPRSSAVRGFIMFDVARSLVHRGLTNDAFIEAPDHFDEGTIGRMIRDVLEAAWPGVPVKSLVDRLTADPARLERDLQAYLRVFG